MRRSPITIELDKVPTSDHFRYVLKWNMNKNEYECNDYNPLLSEGIITNDYIDQLTAQMRRSEYYQMSLCNRCLKTKLMVYVCILCTLIVAGAALTAVYPGVAPIPVILFCILMCSSCGFLAWFLIKSNSRFERRRAELEVCIAEIKLQTFRSLGARIEFSPFGLFISIWFDWKATDNLGYGQSMIHAPIYAGRALNYGQAHFASQQTGVHHISYIQPTHDQLQLYPPMQANQPTSMPDTHEAAKEYPHELAKEYPSKPFNNHKLK